MCHLRQDNPELVGAQTGDRIAVPGRLGKTACHLPEDLVAGLISIGVVDQGETVDIDADHGDLMVVMLGTVDGLMKSVPEKHPVGQFRQDIIMGEIIQLFFQQFLLGDVLGGGDEVGDVSPGILHRGDAVIDIEKAAVFAPVGDDGPVGLTG